MMASTTSALACDKGGSARAEEESKRRELTAAEDVSKAVKDSDEDLRGRASQQGEQTREYSRAMHGSNGLQETASASKFSSKEPQGERTPTIADRQLAMSLNRPWMAPPIAGKDASVLSFAEWTSGEKGLTGEARGNCGANDAHDCSLMWVGVGWVESGVAVAGVS